MLLLGYHGPAAAFGISQRSSTGDFYISTKLSTNNIGGLYVAYAIDNDTGTPYDDVWIEIDSFTGGVVGLAPNEDGRQQLGAMAPVA